ncbi:MAG: formylmethanofuran--tetrahydromethanopterin N-formyltransferase [Alphaproteobacteria bacterium]|nr:formylmethanofuran--tetrahydromethanopterin N-formyltransferase [Alphaproteobacteria bacterium]
MKLNGVEIADGFAEAFGMRATRLVITADTMEWARRAAESLTGFATSVIGCGCEAGIERALEPKDTPDGRPGIAVLVFAASSADLAKQVPLRVGQSVLTCPGTAVYSGLDADETVEVGARLRYFGDGFQIAKRLDGARYWRIPVMDGEFLCADRAGMVRAVGGGNFLILGTTREATRRAAERAVKAMRVLPNVILPFPGGVVRSGSKIGSKYKALIASTNDAYCPTLRADANSALPANVESVLEIVIDGLTESDIAAAMRAGIAAACAPDSGLVRIDAGNYGGKLGKFRFHLREVMG